MRLRSENLPDHLQKSSLARIYLLSGNEPLQMTECADSIRRRARELGFTERKILEVQRGFDWNELALAGANLSLFSSRQLIELRLGTQSPGKDGGKAIADFALGTDSDLVLLLTTQQLDKRSQQTRWFKTVEEHGAVMQIWPVEPARLPAWIAARMRRHGLDIDEQACRLLAQRVEGNLLAAAQEVDKLALLADGTSVGFADAARAVTDSSRFDPFAMFEACLQGDPRRVRRMIRGLRQEGVEVMGVFGATMYELRRLCGMVCAASSGTPRERIFAEYRVWSSRSKSVNAALNRLSQRQATELLREAATIDRVLKGALQLDSWGVLESFLLRIAGADIESPLSGPEAGPVQ